MIHPEIAMFKELHKVDLTLGLEVTISPECEYYEPQYDAGMKYKVTALHVDAGGINIGLSDSTHVSEPPHERWLIETDGFRWGDVTPVLSALTANPQQVKSEDARDAARYRLLREYEIDSYIARGSHEKLDSEMDTAIAAQEPKSDS